MAWMKVSEIAVRLGVPFRTLLQRSKSQKYSTHIKRHDGILLGNWEFFSAEQIKLETAANDAQARIDNQRQRKRQESRNKPKVPTATPPMEPAPPVESTGERDLSDPLDKYRYWNARAAELRVRKAEGELLEAEEIRREAFEAARLARDQLMALPDRLAGLLAAESRPEKCYQMISIEIQKVLEELSASIADIGGENGSTDESDS